jgi:hypothetical protein
VTELKKLTALALAIAMGAAGFSWANDCSSAMCPYGKAFHAQMTKDTSAPAAAKALMATGLSTNARQAIVASLNLV